MLYLTGGVSSKFNRTGLVIRDFKSPIIRRAAGADGERVRDGTHAVRPKRLSIKVISLFMMDWGEWLVRG